MSCRSDIPASAVSSTIATIDCNGKLLLHQRYVGFSLILRQCRIIFSRTESTQLWFPRNAKMSRPLSPHQFPPKFFTDTPPPLTMAESTPDPVKEAKLRIRLPSCVGSKIEFVESHHALSETIADVKEALAATSVLNNLTNYALVYGDVRITDEFDDFSTLEEALGSSGDIDLQLVEAPYTLKKVHEHLLRFRENVGLNFFDFAARSPGVLGGSKLGSLGLRDIEATKDEKKENEDKTTKESEPKTENETKANSEVAKDSKKPGKKGKKAKKQETLEPEPKAEASKPKTETDSDAALATAISQTVSSVLDFSCDLEKHADAESVFSLWKLPLKSFALSPWNPVPSSQRLKGDLLYLTLTTLEGETFSITCHASGFFVNRISNANFNPVLKTNEKGVSRKAYVFYDLVSQLSPLFSQTIAQNKERLATASQFSDSYLLPTQSPALPWSVSQAQVATRNVADASRVMAESFSHGVDGAELAKDWNDEFQGIKEFPRESFNERLLREKLLSKYIQEFRQVAVATAVSIVEGNVVPLNPNEPRDRHIYLRNNIFYSFGVNATGAHDSTGGDEAARYCAAKDVSAVRLLNRVDAPGVSSLLACVVDYLGERVVCQAPVPGVFSEQTDAEGNAVDKVVYGLSLEANEIRTDAEFADALKPLADAFHLKPHRVQLESGADSGQDVVLSKDTKGLKGTDGRKYVIDLYRTTPLDVSFVEKHCTSSETSYPHREASVRHEAVEEWYRRKAAAIFKVETERLEKEGKLEGKERPQVALQYDELNLNPDAFTGVNESADDQKAVRELSEFVSQHLIPEFLNDVAQNAAPFDGAQLSDYMHRGGINMRYLGTIATEAQKKAETHAQEIAAAIEENEKKRLESEKKQKEAEKDSEKDSDKDSEKSSDKTEQSDSDKPEEEKPEEEKSAATLLPVAANMAALQRLCVQEMVARGVKHVLRRLGSSVPLLLKPHFVAHVHNCLLGSTSTVSIDDAVSSLVSKKELAFIKLTPQEIVLLVEREVLVRFRYTLSSGWEKEIHALPLVREIAHKVGIQWKALALRFNKESGHRVLVADDIVSFVPVVKDSSFRCSFVDEIFETARVQIRDGAEVGWALLEELASFYQQIYGTVHTETASFYSSLAQIYAENNMSVEAAIVARRAVILFERLCGCDSYEAINAYVKASFYDSLNKDHESAFKLNTRAFEAWSVVYGPEHPNTVNTLSNFGTVLQELKLTGEARRFFEKAIELSEKLNGASSDITAIIRHRLGVLLVQASEFQAALEQFQAAGAVFSKVVGHDDVLSKECRNFAGNIAKYLAYTEQQKKMAAQAKPKAKPTVVKPVKAKKNHTPTPDPEIASKSVDEILQFIEGGLGKKNKKKK